MYDVLGCVAVGNEIDKEEGARECVCMSNIRVPHRREGRGGFA